MASSLDQINVTKNWLEYNQKNSHQQTLLYFWSYSYVKNNNISGTRKETTFLKRGYFKKRKRKGERKVVSTISGWKVSGRVYRPIFVRLPVKKAFDKVNRFSRCVLTM